MYRPTECDCGDSDDCDGCDRWGTDECVRTDELDSSDPGDADGDHASALESAYGPEE